LWRRHRRVGAGGLLRESSSWQTERSRRWSVAASLGLQSQRSGGDDVVRVGTSRLARRSEAVATKATVVITDTGSSKINKIGSNNQST
jgi:hypothetical protein